MLTPRARTLFLSQLTVLGCIAAGSLGCDEPAPTSDDETQQVGDNGAAPSDGADDESDPDNDAKPSAGSKDAAKGNTKPDAEHVKLDGGTALKTDAGLGAETSAGPKLDGGAASAPAQGCTAKLLDVPDDVLAKGPWDTGVRTVKIGRLTVELFYPAKPGSTAGKPEVTYDSRQWLPAAERKKITDEHAHILEPVGGHLYRDVPIDDEHGPYPTVVFIHGTASHRAASATTNKHWASRGFVVLAADYPGLGLGDQMASTLECSLPTSGSQDIPGDVNLQLAALKSPSGELAFLGDRADLRRLAVSGHSQGGCITATLATLPNVKVLIPLSGSMPVGTAGSVESILYVSGMKDQVIGYDFPLIGNTVCPLGASDTIDAYVASPGPPKVKKRLVGIAGGGHLSVTDLCSKNKLGKSSVEELQAAGVCGVGSAVIIGLPALFDCGSVDWKKGVEAVNYVTTAALEETLSCGKRTSAFASITNALPQVGEFREELK